MRVLGIETSCDETSVALVQLDGERIEISHHRITSQVDAHRPFGGVVPELATRRHLQNLPFMARQVLEEIKREGKSLDGVAATRGPGLNPALLVGVGYAKGLALALGKPWLGVNHLEGHLMSPFLTESRTPECPHIALIASGGHTQLVNVRAIGSYEILGTTLDDAAGEAFDKVAKLLGLPYPGGPEIEVRARQGNSSAITFPRCMLHSGCLSFSFSGLKTAVRQWVENNGLGGLDDICASFQACVIEILCEKTRQAIRRKGYGLTAASGGVSNNKALREALTTMAREEGAHILFAAPELTGDNAAMIAAAGALRLARGERSQWREDVEPNLKLAS